MPANVAPGAANWICSGAPAGDEPSGKASEPDSRTGPVRTRREEACMLIPASGPA